MIIAGKTNALKLRCFYDILPSLSTELKILNFANGNGKVLENKTNNGLLFIDTYYNYFCVKRTSQVN